MSLLILGLVLFLGIHTVPMMQGLRGGIRSAASPALYQVLLSLVSAVGLVLIVWGYGQMQGQGRLNPEIYTPPIWLRHVTLLLMWPAMILLVAAYVPSRIRTKAKHPMLAGIKLWALAHLLANGDLASLILVGSFLAWAVVDRISVKKRAALGPLGAKTGGLVGDLIAVAGGTAVYLVLLLWAHKAPIGVSPMGV